MIALGGPVVGTGPLSSGLYTAAPTAVVTGPTGTVATTTSTVSWSYSSPLSYAQVSYRIQLRTSDDATVLYDSGTVSGSGTSAAIPYLLSSGSTYRVWVYVSDLFDTSVPAYGGFLVRLADVSDYPDETSVGSVYEVGINGTGFMLRDQPAGEMRYRRRTIPLEAPRFATGDTPFSQAIERYTQIGWNDWSGGAGVRLHDGSDTGNVNRFWDSEGVNPFTEKELSLLPATSLGLTTTYASALCTVAGDELYTLTGAKQLTHQATPGGSSTAFSVAAAGTVSDMTSDGTYWYVCDTTNVWRNSSAADPGAAWSTRDAYLVEWISDRIAVAEPSTGSTPNQLTTISEDGATATVRATLPVGTTIRSITSGDGYVWFAADRYQRSAVWAWKLGSTDAAFVAFELPAGQVARTVGFYQGNVMVRAIETKSSGTRAIIYRAAQSEGKLVPTRVLEIDDGALDQTVGDFGGDDRYIAFSWKEMTTADRSGIGVIDLATGGWAKWLYAPADAGDGDVGQILSWKGLFVFVVRGYGVCHETTTSLTTGWLKTWHTDLGSTLTKVVDKVQFVCDSLPANGTVALEYSLDGGGVYTSAGPTTTVGGTKSGEFVVAAETQTLGLKITLGASGTAPVLRALGGRVHPLGLVDQIIVMPLDLDPRRNGLNGRELPYSSNRTVGWVENLVGTRIRLQDIDWPVTQTGTIWEVVDATVETTGAYDRQKNRRDDSPVAILTLRRSLK